MLKIRTWALILIITILLCLFYFYRKPDTGAFNKQVWSVNEFAALMQDETMTGVYKPEPRNILGQVGIELILPDPSLQESTIQISSYRLSNKQSMNVYLGPYKKIIILEADPALLGDGSSKSDGYDSLEVTFIDTKNRITYTCMQERPFLMWQLNKIVTINFLPERKADKNGEPYCYDAYIHQTLKS